ncbi:MAG: hypothetical protein ACTS5F_00430 [Candidatus Hodgkinia cicadicola]
MIPFMLLAHFHYVLALAAVFGVLATWYYWFPKEIEDFACCIIVRDYQFNILPQRFLGLIGCKTMRWLSDCPKELEPDAVSSIRFDINVIVLFICINYQSINYSNNIQLIFKTKGNTLASFVLLNTFVINATSVLFVNIEERAGKQIVC